METGVATSALGIDIGGSGMKAAPIDTTTGELLAERLRIETPTSASPAAMIPVIAQLLEHFSWQGPVGITFPGVVRHGRTLTAANLHPDWIGLDAAGAFAEVLGHRPVVVNDADAAGVAEARFGAARDVDGVVLLLTLGTGIGTALINDGALVPNTELGHLVVDGHDAETRAAASAREREDLGWKEYSGRLTRYLNELERLLWPDLFVVGGGISEKFDKFGPRLEITTPAVPAALRNRAGIVGAAVLAAERSAPA
jgi:polyphosphate glucokinase